MVAVGGAIGSVARYLIAGWVQSVAWSRISLWHLRGQYHRRPGHGLLTELMALKFNVSPEMRAFLTTGILGGYTTFSTFSLDSALLIERGAYGQRRGLYRRLGRAVRSWRCSPASGSCARSMPELRTIAPKTMTASAWTAGSSGIIRR